MLMTSPTIIHTLTLRDTLHINAIFYILFRILFIQNIINTLFTKHERYQLAYINIMSTSV